MYVNGLRLGATYVTITPRSVAGTYWGTVEVLCLFDLVGSGGHVYTTCAHSTAAGATTTDQLGGARMAGGSTPPMRSHSNSACGRPQTFRATVSL